MRKTPWNKELDRLIKQEDEEECDQRGPGREKDNKQKEIGKKGRDWDAFPNERLALLDTEPWFVLQRL